MNDKFIQSIKTLLLNKKEELFKQVAQEIVVDVEGDEVDKIQGSMIIQLSNHLNTRNSDKLKQIESALTRIDNNTFGLCQDCEEPIAEKRLLSNPYFQTCISCAEDREMTEKLRRINKG